VSSLRALFAAGERTPDNSHVPFCSSCGESVPAGARFCPNCAAAISETADPSEERKLATLLFADLVGSTELGGSEDPERTRAMLTQFYDLMATEIVEAGGTVEKFAGDAVMAAFGAPVSHEDDAERALHAALSMQRRLADLFGGALALRIGVNTGEVVLGTAREGSSFVTGDAVNVAARLEQAAEPGEILVGERTAAVVRGAFELGEPVTVEAKGKPEGIVARRLLRALTLARPRGVGGLPTAFAGRANELDALETAYGRVADEGRSHLVSIIGEAGVGKTRLVREFWAWLGTHAPEALRRTGRCAPYGQGVTYLPIGEIVREHLGLLESDSTETVRDHLGKREFLGLTLGLEAPSGLHPLAARDRLQWACAQFIEELAADQPVVVLVEDIHWAEPDLLDLLDSLIRDVHGPLLLLTTARPEPTAGRQAWSGREESTSIWLEPLAAADAALMLDTMIPGELSARLRDAIVERAEGNPFFVEELVGTLIDQGAVVHENGGWAVREQPENLIVPDTVQALLAARIDRLDSPEKAALQAASVIGRVFWAGPIYELLDDVEPDLRLLEERDFIRRQAGSSFSGEREYAFKHALTRHVAYTSVPKAKRARLHARFAGWLEHEGGGRDEHVGLLAHHYAEAAREDDADLAWQGEEEALAQVRMRAVRWLQRAAALAVGRYEMNEGVSLLHRALALETSVRGQVQLWREIAHANALYFDGEAFSTAMQQAIDLADSPGERGDLYAEFVFQMLVRAGMWRVLPDSELVDGWINRALELERSETAGRAKALIARCYADYRKSPQLAREASAIAERLGEPELRSYGFDVLGLTAFTSRDYEEALDWQRRRVLLVDEIEDPDHRADTYANAIPPAMARGAFDEASKYTSAHFEITRALSPHHRLHGISAVIELEELLGHWDRIRELQAEVEQAVADNVATPCVRNERSLLVCALANAYEGDEESTRRLENLAEANAMEGYGTVIGAPRQQLALHRGDTDRVASLLGEPAVRRSTWFYLSSVATHLDALAALGERDRVESEAPRLAGGSVYLEPFALRALGIVRSSEDLLQQAAERFAALGLAWQAARCRRG
jgi:class 3 adenylate cyclase